MQIVPYPHPALRWKSAPVTEINEYLRTTVRKMFDLMYEAKGIGLAANQVALPWRFFIINLTGDPAEVHEEMVFINPEIVKRCGTIEDEEGCLSFPKLYGQVRRAEEIVVEAFDLQGQGFQMKLDELAGRAIQHETDHLDGMLFTDRMSEELKTQYAPILAEFEATFRKHQELNLFLSDEEIRKELARLEAGPPRP